MNAVTRLQGALRGWRATKLAGVAKVEGAAALQGATQRRALPPMLQPWRPVQANVAQKPTAANLRTMAQMPVVRRAINYVKDRVCNMAWEVRLKAEAMPDAHTEERMRVLNRLMRAPNPRDSFRTFVEQVLEDVVVGGFGAVRIVRDEEDSLQLCPVDGAMVQVNVDWDGEAEVPRYALAPAAGSAGFGSVAPEALLDTELMYVRLNARTHTPLGLGRVEVAFDTVNQFLSAHRHAGRLANNSVVQYALWLDEATPAQHERLIRWWQDEVEGTGQVPILSTERKPEVLRFGQGTDEDLRLRWQEFLLRIVASAFDLPAMFLGLESDVNRSTAEEMSSQAFESAVLPVANLLAEHITRDVFDKVLRWSEFEFVFATEARDEASVVQQQLQLLEAGVLTVDEVRAQRGYRPMLFVKQEEQAKEDDAAGSDGGQVS